MANYFPTPTYLMVIFIVTRLIPIISNSSSLSQPWELAGKLSTASTVLESAATDFGGTTKILPAAVLNPSSVDDIANLVKFAYNSPVSFPVAARGHGHSIRGQAAADGGVVVNMRSLKARKRRENDSVLGVTADGSTYIDVGGEWLWIEVLNETLKFRFSPVSWTDYLYLTVGGTLSNGGISGQTFRYGPQITNVLEMDVITGKGEIVTCSKDKNSDLFHAVLGGLGQFGIITRARIPLQPAPKRVKWLRFLYNDFSDFSRDQEHLISEANGLDFLEGSLMLHHGSPDNWRSTFFPMSDHPRIISMVKKHRIIYCLEIVKYYDDHNQFSITKEIEELMEGLNYTRGFKFEKDVTYVEFLNRVRTGELKLKSKGQWDVPHPWLNLFVPKSQISDFDFGVFKDIVLKNNVTTGPVLVYPMNRNKWNNQMSTVVPEEDIFYTIGLLHSGGFDDWEAYENENKEILQFCEKSKIKVIKYLPHYESSEGWIDHFGLKWSVFRERKARYDPRMILSPGQNIFQ